MLLYRPFNLSAYMFVNQFYTINIFFTFSTLVIVITSRLTNNMTVLSPVCDNVLLNNK